MANPNPPYHPNPNPEIKQYVRQYGFGAPGGADPVAAAKKAKPYSIANEIRRLAAQEIDVDDPMAYKPKGRMSRGEQIALKQLERAKDGDNFAATTVLERVDGKVSQTISGDPENPLVMLHVPITESERARRITEILDAARSRIPAVIDNNGELPVGTVSGAAAEGAGE